MSNPRQRKVLEMPAQPTDSPALAGESYTLKTWRNGTCIDVQSGLPATVAISTAVASTRALNIGQANGRPLVWWQLGSEWRIGFEYWAENDIVTYVTPD